MHNDIRRSAIAACALLLSLACALPSGAAPTPGAPKPAPSVTDRATAMFDAGQYAKAKAALEAFVAAPPAGAQPDEVQKAQRLLDQAKAALIDQYRSVEAARQRAKADEAKRAEEKKAREAADAKTLAEADRLVKLAEAGHSPETNAQEANRLYAQVASDRAVAAFNLAMDYYNEGQYDKARTVLDHLNKYVKDNASNPEFKSGLGADREARVAAYVQKLPDARENLDQGRMLAMTTATPPPTGPSEAQRKALKIFDEGLAAFDKGQYEEARGQFEAVQKTGVSLGKEKDALLLDKLKQIAARKSDVETRRAAAVANIKSGDELLKKGDWKGAREFLNKAAKDDALLTQPQRAQLVDLFAQVEAKEKQSTAEVETAKRVDEYLAQVKRTNKILEDQEKTTAAMYLALAKDDYAALNYDGALKNAEEALKHQPDNAEALELKANVLFQTGKVIAPSPYLKEFSAEQRTLYDQVRTQIDLAVQRGRSDMEQKKYVEASDQFGRALDSLEFLRPAMDVREVESQVRGLLKQAEAAKAQADEEIRVKKEVEALKDRQAQVARERASADSKKIYLFSQANAEFAKGNYDNAIKLANEVIAADPENTAASDLINDARQHQRRKTWDSILDADHKAVEDERVRLRMKAIFPGAIFMYPAKELWEEIKARPPVELPSGKAVKTPKELELEAILDQELKGVSLPGVTLHDAIETILKPTLKALTGKDINFQVDPDPALNIGETTITLDVKDTSLRNLLLSMLRPNKLNFIISRDRIYISTFAGCRREEAMGDLSFRQYDVSDLMVVLETTGGLGSGSTGSTGTTGTTGTSGTSTSGTGTTGGSGVNDVLSLIVQFTGSVNWDSVNAAASSSSNGSTGGTSGTSTGVSTGGSGTSGTSGLVIPTVGEAGVTEDVLKNNPPGRIMYLRGVWLMVNQTDRVHKIIEDLLAELRAQTHIQVQIEATFLEWTDNFMKDVGVQWANLPAWNIGGQTLPFGGHIPASSATITYKQEPSANIESLSIFQMGITFLNQAQTSLLIHAAESSQNAIVTDTPHVTCINTVSTTLTLATAGSYVSSYSVQSGIAVPVLTPYIPSSVSLTVQPYVSGDRRYVSLILSPNFTTAILGQPLIVTIPIQGITTSGQGSTSTTVTIFTPQTTTNSMQSTIKVPDRGAAVMGGLSHVEEVTQEGGVPILMHIPLLKRLFLNTAVAKTRFHNIFLASPTIMMEKEYEP